MVFYFQRSAKFEPVASLSRAIPSTRQYEACSRQQQVELAHVLGREARPWRSEHSNLADRLPVTLQSKNAHPDDDRVSASAWTGDLANINSLNIVYKVLRYPVALLEESGNDRERPR